MGEMGHIDKRAVSLDKLRKGIAKEKSIAKKLEASNSSPPDSLHRQPQNRQQQHSPEHHKTPEDAVAHIGGNRGADRKPFALVWAPLPVVSWFVPLIGHTGITNSQGLVYDFSDDFSVTVDHLPFGEPTKYYQFDPMQVGQGDNLAAKTVAWDRAILAASSRYTKTRHSFCFNNCHHYIACVLNNLNYDSVNNWNQHHIWRLITFHSKYTGCMGVVRQWWHFTAILLTLFAIGGFLLS